MNTIEKDLKELLSLRGDCFDDRLDQLRIKYTSPEDRAKLAEALLSEMKDTRKDMERISDDLDELTIKERLKDIVEIVSLSYIAKHYFGKSRGWLYQRINGNRVRGKVYTLNDREKDILNNAFRDISKKIGSLSV